VSDLVGKVLYNEQIAANYGLIERFIPISEYSAGIYFVQIHSKDKIEVIKFIIY
jgi:hypothetical protein